MEEVEEDEPESQEDPFADPDPLPPPPRRGRGPGRRGRPPGKGGQAAPRGPSRTSSRLFEGGQFWSCLRVSLKLNDKKFLKLLF